jgi:hypothetical protein
LDAPRSHRFRSAIKQAELKPALTKQRLNHEGHEGHEDPHRRERGGKENGAKRPNHIFVPFVSFMVQTLFLAIAVTLDRVLQ